MYENQTEWSDYDDTPPHEEQKQAAQHLNGKIHPTPEEAVIIHRIRNYDIPAVSYTTESWFGNHHEEEQILKKLREPKEQTLIAVPMLETAIFALMNKI